MFSHFCDLDENLFSTRLLPWKNCIPTVVLISPDKEKLLAFGYEANDQYAELVETGQDGDYYYFENCGTDLEKIFQKPHVTDVTMQDVTGKSISSIRVLAFVTKYLIDELMSSYPYANIRQNEITLTVVVPTLSTDGAKQSVREAARPLVFLQTL